MIGTDLIRFPIDCFFSFLIQTTIRFIFLWRMFKNNFFAVKSIWIQWPRVRVWVLKHLQQLHFPHKERLEAVCNRILCIRTAYVLIFDWTEIKIVWYVYCHHKFQKIFALKRTSVIVFPPNVMCLNAHINLTKF